MSNKDWKLQKVAVVRNNSAAVLTTFKINCMAGRFVLGEKKWSNGVSVASLLMHYRFSSFYLNVHSCQCISLSIGALTICHSRLFKITGKYRSVLILIDIVQGTIAFFPIYLI